MKKKKNEKEQKKMRATLERIRGERIIIIIIKILKRENNKWKKESSIMNIFQWLSILPHSKKIQWIKSYLFSKFRQQKNK